MYHCLELIFFFVMVTNQTRQSVKCAPCLCVFSTMYINFFSLALTFFLLYSFSPPIPVRFLYISLLPHIIGCYLVVVSQILSCFLYVFVCRLGSTMFAHNLCGIRANCQPFRFTILFGSFSSFKLFAQKEDEMWHHF